VSAGTAEECGQWELMLHGFLDDELDAAHALQFERHLATCEHCATELQRFRTLKRVVGRKEARWQTPDDLRERIMTLLAEESATNRHAFAGAPPARLPTRGERFNVIQFIKQWSFVPALAALAASLFLVLIPPSGGTLQNELVASHVRSLLVDHLTDVTTSNQHTVRPWFNGKIDFSPPVVDLAAEGFPLVGGRVDYVGGRVVAALVYRRREHVINLFAWPGTVAMTTAAQDGYNVVTWSSGDLIFSAVSDVNEADLDLFRDQFIAQTSK